MFESVNRKTNFKEFFNFISEKWGIIKVLVSNWWRFMTGSTISFTLAIIGYFGNYEKVEEKKIFIWIGIIVLAVSAIWQMLRVHKENILLKNEIDNLKTSKLKLTFKNDKHIQSATIIAPPPFNEYITERAFLAGVTIENTSVVTVKNLKLMLLDIFFLKDNIFQDIGFMGNIEFKLDDNEKILNPHAKRYINILIIDEINKRIKLDFKDGKTYLNPFKDIGVYRLNFQATAENSGVPEFISLKLNHFNPKSFMELDIEVIENEMI